MFTRHAPGQDQVVTRSDEAAPVDPPAAFTRKQGQYLAFIYYYTKLNGTPPAQRDFQSYFRATPPTVHSMILRLEKGGWLSRRPGAPRSLKLLVQRGALPDLE